LKTGILCAAVIVLAACDRSDLKISGPLRQRGYIWQREWTPAVVDSLGEALKRMDGVVLLGAEITLTGKRPDVVKASIDWEAVKRQGGSCSVALRVAPFAGPFREDDASARMIVDVTKELLGEARAHAVKIEEFQFDFDCAQKNLGNYRVWLRMLRAAVQPVRFVITVLPAWLGNSEFLPLVREADGYVLQVHSVPICSGNGATLCDTRSAREWEARAARLGVPFSVALPTYRCTAGYGPDGKLLGVAMDSVQPSWPPSTRILEFGTDADDVAALVNDWHTARPPQLRELLWYRVPVATDTRNWQWSTLSAVIAGRKPLHRLEIGREGENPIDLSITNSGEADEELDSVVTASWDGNAIVAADALPGWILDSTNRRAVFRNEGDRKIRLSPGGKRQIGWLRFERPVSLRLELAKKNETGR
jgi:hypothetical protein